MRNCLMESIWSDFDRFFDISYKTENNFPINVSFAGYSKKDLTIEISRGYLTILADNEKMGKTNYNMFIGEGCNNEDIVATMENGLLTLDIKKEKKQSKKIEIK